MPLRVPASGATGVVRARRYVRPRGALSGRTMAAGHRRRARASKHHGWQPRPRCAEEPAVQDACRRVVRRRLRIPAVPGRPLRREAGCRPARYAYASIWRPRDGSHGRRKGFHARGVPGNPDPNGLPGRAPSARSYPTSRRALATTYRLVVRKPAGSSFPAISICNRRSRSASAWPSPSRTARPATAIG